MGASFLPIMMFTLLWGGVGIVLPFLVPKGATQGLPDNNGSEQESHHQQQQSESAFLSFHPKYFDFKESPVGVPCLGVVRVDNRLKNEIKLISISGNTVHFHSSFFADKVIGPESNTTFEVVFLSRVEGLVESNLYIHTSKGLFKYYVKGFGLPNPYRLRPLVGARIPVNGTYEPLITMHNTHDTRIQVVEMHSSGADFHLQLPDDAVEQDAGSAWAIEPYETKSVMKGSFQGKADGNHTGFIKIRVNSTAASSEYLLLPVEVQVSSEPGMYSPQDSLDFGLLVQSDKPKTLSLFIINAERKPVNIQSVSVKGAPNPAVKIEFRPLVIEPDNSVSTVVALVTFDPSQAFDYKHSNGMIQILSECGKSVSVPFRAAVMHGALEFNASSLGFFVKSDHIPPRNFSVRNNFSATVAIYHVAVSHPDLVKVNSFNQTHIIPPGEQKTIFSMKIQRKGEICDARNKIEVTVKSNVTNIKLPLTCYDGKLQMHTFENGEIDCGRIEMHSTHTEYFSVENKNPVEIRLKSWGSNSSWGHVELVGMQKGVREDLERIKDFDNLKKSLFLQPGYMAVFSIEIRRPTVEGTYFGEAYVTTDHNQTLRIPFRFAVSKGSVYADTFIFDKVFPGKISCEKLYLGSTYNRTLLLNAIRSKPPKLLWFTPSPSETPEILPLRRSYVGKVHFDPRKFCDPDCYSGFALDSPVGKQWIKAINVGWEGSEIDWSIFSTLQQRYESVSDSTVSNISVWVDTTETGGYKVLAQINYIWPRISSLRPIVFPLTALGNESIVEIPVSNPSSFPLFVQAVLARDYGPLWFRFAPGNPTGSINSNNNGNSNSFTMGNYSAGEIAFKLSGILSSSSQQNGSTEISEVQMQLFQDILDSVEKTSNSHFPTGIAFVLPPGAKYFLRTSFKPQSKDIASTVILLRNNLTGIEVISVKGRAGTGQLTVGSGTPGSSLLFQLTEKLLQACQAEHTSKYVPPQLTVRRSFIARNIGEIPLDIRALEIYPPQNSFFGFNWQLPFGLNGVGLVSTGTHSAMGESCEGYGFRILNCHPFTLQPNHTHSIDIAFSPDFTMSKVIRTLRLVDSTGGEFNYTLVAMIPSKMLSICSSVISRPTWEYLLKIFLVIGVSVAFIASALMAYVEAGSVVSSTVVATVRVVSSSEAASKDAKENTSKLDLKAVYDKVENRFKRNNNKEGSKSGSSVCSNSSVAGSNVVGNGVSSGGSKTNQVLANGSTMLSNNNNSTLRNRRSKKNVEHNSGGANIGAATSKLVDKSNQKSSSPPVEDSIASSSSANNFSKKNKENSPSGGSGGDSFSSSSMTGKKKKGGNNVLTSNSQINSGGKKKRRNSGGSSSLSNVCMITGGNGKGLSKAEQEETSSTTTESSNSDDFYIPTSSASSDKKTQQLPSKSSSPQETTAQASHQNQSSGKKGKNDGTKKSKGGNEGGKSESDSLFDGNSVQKGSSPTEEIINSGSGGGKKNKGKKKEAQSGSGLYGTDFPQSSGKMPAAEGKSSPTSLSRQHGLLNQDISVWDSPQCPIGDGLSEMAAQTEAFVMHRPNSSTNQHKKSGSAEQLMGSSSATSHDMRHARNSHSPQFSQVLQMSSGYGQLLNQQQQQQALHTSGNAGSRHRRPPAGVIGQSRYGLGNGSGMMSPTGSYFQGQTLSQHQGGRQHAAPIRTLSNPSGNMMSMNSGWGTDILPDNGCDIWSRKSSLDTVGPGAGSSGLPTFSSVASTCANDLPMYSSGSVMQPGYSSLFDGFPSSSSPGLSNRSSDDGGYFSLGNNGNGGITSSTGQTNPVSSIVGNSARTSGRSRNDNSQMFGYGMDIFSTLNLPLSSPNYNDCPVHYRSAAATSRQSQVPTSGTGGDLSNNYLQRMRNEADGRDNNSGYASKNWNDVYLLENMGMPSSSRLMPRSSNSPGTLESKAEGNVDSAWPSSSTAGTLSSTVASGGSTDSLSRERSFLSEWATLASSSNVQPGRRSVGNMSEIWEPANLGATHDSSSNKWPTSFDTAGSDSSVVGSGARSRMGDGLGDLGFRPSSTRNSDVPQNHHREVEAGLGFNPFTSNIWNQNNSSDNNWSPASSTSYHYSNRE